MQIMPNKSILEGVAKRLVPAPDGHGADLDFFVDRGEAAEGHTDFIQAIPGTTLTLFAAEPAVFEVGKRYRVTASVLGGPTGEQTVVEAADAIA